MSLTWIVGLLADVVIPLLNSANNIHASGGYKKTGNDGLGTVNLGSLRPDKMSLT